MKQCIIYLSILILLFYLPTIVFSLNNGTNVNNIDMNGTNSSNSTGIFQNIKMAMKNDKYFALKVSVIFAILTFVFSLITFPFIIYNKISEKVVGIDRELPYALSFMSILASTGTTPLDMIRKIAHEDFGYVSKEFRKMLYRVDYLGEDIITAMNYLANSTPSKKFREICIELSSIIHTGSGLRDFLNNQNRELMAIKKNALKEYMDLLGMYAEIYLGGVVMTTVMGLIGIILIGTLGIELPVLTLKQLFMLFVYFVVPFMNFMYLIILILSGGND